MIVQKGAQLVDGYPVEIGLTVRSIIPSFQIADFLLRRIRPIQSPNFYLYERFVGDERGTATRPAGLYGSRFLLTLIRFPMIPKSPSGPGGYGAFGFNGPRPTIDLLWHLSSTLPPEHEAVISFFVSADIRFSGAGFEDRSRDT